LVAAAAAKTRHLNIMERIQNTTMNQLSGITQQLKELLSVKRPTKEKADDSYRKKLK
jgi:predicted phage gp36 major capsid-like protein